MRLLLSSLLCVFLLSSCASSKMAKMQKMHEAELSGLINQDLEKQIDGLAQTFVDVLEEALSFKSTRCSIKHVENFSSSNQQELTALIQSIETQMNNLSGMDKFAFALGIGSKPYIEELITLVPKFEKRVGRSIKTFTIASKFINLMNPLN